jgi:hypothetical protein
MKNILSSVENVVWKTSGSIYKVLIEDEELLKNLESKIRSSIDDNVSYKTNVKGSMTGWKTFLQDKDFKKLLFIYFDMCSIDKIMEQYKSKKDGLFHLNVVAAWGNILKKEDKVIRHKHLGVSWSSVLYFDDYANLKTDAGNIETKRGLVVTLPSYLNHWVEPIQKDVERCSLVWNWSFIPDWIKNEKIDG